MLAGGGTRLPGAFALEVLTGAALSGDALRLVGTGLLGAFTTFSTWMYDTHHLDRRRAVANIVVSLVLGLLVAALGRELGELF